MTRPDRIALTAVLLALAVLALYAAAELASTTGYAVAFFLGGSAIALTFPHPKDDS